MMLLIFSRVSPEERITLPSFVRDVIVPTFLSTFYITPIIGASALVEPFLATRYACSTDWLTSRAISSPEEAAPRRTTLSPYIFYGFL